MIQRRWNVGTVAGMTMGLSLLAWGSPAMAGRLFSGGLATGSGGVACTVRNMLDTPVTVFIDIRDNDSGCTENPTIAPFELHVLSCANVSGAASCMVEFGENSIRKRIAASFYTIDGNGAATAAVPVDAFTNLMP